MSRARELRHAHRRPRSCAKQMLSDSSGDDREFARAEAEAAAADIERLDARAQAAAAAEGPERRSQRHRRDPRRRRRRGSEPLRSRPVPDVPGLRAADGLEARGARLRRVGDGRLQRDHVPAVGRRRVDAHEARGRPAPRAARAGHRVAGTDPHVVRHRHGAARGRGGRRRHRRARPASRRVPVVGPRRAVGEHDRLGRAHHPQADRSRRRRCRTRRARSRTGPRRCRCCALGCSSSSRTARRRRRPRRGAARSAAADAARRSARTTTRRTASPTIASGSRSTSSTRVLAGDLDEISDALVHDEQARRLSDSVG